MTANERNVLVALMHPANSVNHRQAGAIRSALAEIDALNEALGAERSRVMNLVSRITGKPGDTTNEAVGEASREALALRERESAKSRALVDIVTVALDDLDYGSVPMTNAERRSVKESAAHLCRFLSSVGTERRALRQQVATLTAERDEALSRAIPKPWVESDHLEIQATFRSRVERVAIGQHVEGACLSVRTNGISNDQTLDTLADALDAAAKESP